MGLYDLLVARRGAYRKHRAFRRLLEALFIAFLRGKYVREAKADPKSDAALILQWGRANMRWLPKSKRAKLARVWSKKQKKTQKQKDTK